MVCLKIAGGDRIGQVGRVADRDKGYDAVPNAGESRDI
jgi:hypothetical protein